MITQKFGLKFNRVPLDDHRERHGATQSIYCDTVDSWLEMGG